ncbi:sugar transferase [Cryobacterium sp. RTC2.1]|uniref:sugar transferase n=1 Tax=unclassified Cryobacterium TaxID=2649013 RepID=UPI002B221EFA|nr:MULTISPECIES: sugar transferase [unclassified Cryobacterium]MEB0004384.1 sugar transferase [Cryobacterium sp. RTC2.1]MEB0203208.1 sugar transferase [Cryobacterium sp. 5I3]
MPGERNADRHRETGRHHLVVAPGLTDLGGPRINTRPVAGLPLIHVETPRFEVGKRFTKRAFDLVIGGLLLLVLSLVMAVTALSIRLVGIGPVLTREQRIGSGGRPFTLLGFGSVDARRPGAPRRAPARAGAASVSTNSRNCSACSPARCPSSDRARRSRTRSRASTASSTAGS